jgi:HlyD family secretion protein
MSRTRTWITVALVVVGAGGAAAWWAQRPPPVPAEKYRTALIDRGPIAQAVLASGTLQPVTSVTVGTQVSGTVLERKADFNDRVKRGQVLLRLDPSTLQARLRQVQAQLASAEASLALARGTFERNQRLVAQGFISALALDQSQRELDAARAAVDLARAQKDAAQTDLDNSVIRSPIDGIVIRRNIDVGQTVAASFSTPELYVLARDLARMQIHTNVSEADVGGIAVGQVVRFTVDAYPDTEFEGKVQQFRLNASTNQGVVTYTIVVDVPNNDERLKPGMTAQTRIVLQSKPEVLRLPTASLRFQPDEDERKAIAAQQAKFAADVPAAASASLAQRSAQRHDDGVLTRTGAGQRVLRVWTVGPGQVPQAHEVTVGIANTRYTELTAVLSGSLKAGDAVIVRRVEAQPGR